MAVPAQVEATLRSHNVADLYEQRFHRAFWASPDCVVISRFADGRLIDVNQSFERITGYRAEEVVGKTSVEIGLWVDERKRDEWVALFAETGSVREIELKLRMRSGEVRTFQASSERMQIGDEACLVTIVRDVTTRKAHEALLFSTAQGVAAEADESFFRSLANYFAGALHADFAFVGELLPDTPSRVRTVAAVQDRLPMETFEYDLAGSPCAEVVSLGSCAFPRGVAREFPGDLFLAEKGIQAYVGHSLADSSGRPLGIIAVMFRSPLEDTRLAESMLRTFAVRASAELVVHQLRVLARAILHRGVALCSE